MAQGRSGLAATCLALALTIGAATAQEAAPETAPETAQAAPALSVALAPPERQVWPVRLQTNGRMQAWHEALIAAETGGQRIESVNADVGSVVKKGEVLARLSTDTLKNTIIQQEATVLSAEAALEQARADADRARTLRNAGSSAISEQQVTQYLVTERKADADLASARAALASTQLDLERTTIHTPDDGVISSRSASMGNVVASGTELFRLIRQSRIEWQAEVPIRFLGQITEGTEVAIPTPIGTEVQGKVRLISPTASETTGRVIVYCAMTPPADAPMPKIGMMLSGYFNLGDTEALTVPAAATSMRDGFTYVFALNEGAEPATVTRKRVEIGRRNGDRVEILSGVAATDQIVQAGGAFLSEGSVVNVVDHEPTGTEVSQ